MAQPRTAKKTARRTPARRKRLRVALYLNDTERATVLNLTKCLRNWGMSFQSVYRDELARLRPGDADVLLLHGGWYGFKEGMPERRAILRFVKAGGGCVGVCCGAMVICKIGLIQVEEMVYNDLTGWMRMRIAAPKHPIAKGVRLKSEKKGEEFLVPIAYFNGPRMKPKKKSTVKVAVYDNDYLQAAALADDYGKGRAVAFGPHPEKEQLDEVVTHSEPLPRAALLLHNALYWAAHRTPPRLSWAFPKFEVYNGSIRPQREIRTVSPIPEKEFS